MAKEIAFVRLDSRLIHGQVATNMLRSINCKKLVIVSDNLCNDAFQRKILKATCPAHLKFDLISTKEAGDSFKAGTFGKDGAVFVLFADVKNAYDAYKAGLKYDSMQIGGLRDSSDGRILVADQTNINETEAVCLEELAKDGVNIYVQKIASVKAITWKSIKDKYFPNI